MTAEEPEGEEAASQYRGVVSIEWPAANGTGPYSCMSGRGVKVTDAVSGKMITTCSGLAVHADADGLVTADLTLFADADGEPLFEGAPVEKDGEVLTGTFPFLVGEMRVRAS